MKKFKKIAKILLIVVVALGVSGYIYFNSAYPQMIEAEDIKIDRTPERIERGKYIFNHVAACVDCHSERDFTKLSGPVKPGTEGKGGDKFDEEFGMPGTFYARNITPYKLESWTDGEIVRAVTEGISKDGTALFPLMPYLVYGKMDKEDIYSVVAYIRTLPAIQNDPPKSKPKFPVSMLMKTLPTKNMFRPKPDTSNTLEYGKYLLEMASCTDCHTQSDEGKPIEGKYLAGGIEIKLPGNTVVRTHNLTPDETPGIMDKGTIYKKI